MAARINKSVIESVEAIATPEHDAPAIDSSGRNVTPKDIAESLGVDAKALRAFIRSITTNQAGRGGAWRFTNEEAAMIIDRWTNKRSIRATAPVFKDA